MLIDGLLLNGIAPDDIHIFIGGHDRYKWHSNNQITYHEVDHNSFDLTALITICQRNIFSTPYWFLLHDTVKVGDRFKQCVSSKSYIGLKAVPLCYGGSMNMGLYSSPYLKQISQDILSYRNTNYDPDYLIYVKKLAIEVEDKYLREYYQHSYDTGRRVFEDVKSPYEHCPPRTVEYYEQIDLFKFKANCGGLIRISI